MTKRASPRQSGMSRTRVIDRKTIGTNLFVADLELLDKELEKRHQTRSEFIRDLVHQWAIKKRMSQNGASTTKAEMLALQKQAVTEIGDLRKALETIIEQGKETTDLLGLNDTEIKRILTTGAAHFNLSAQAFTSVWAVLDFLQRYVVDPSIGLDPQFMQDPRAEAMRQLQQSREQGLQMTEVMAETFGSPVAVQMVLISPPGER